MKLQKQISLAFFLAANALFAGQEVGTAPVYAVAEVLFHGPRQNPSDTPARDIEFWVRFRHESGSPEFKVHGFWDGDGQGGLAGDVFKVRFCPTKPGRWTLAEVQSNRRELAGQHQGDFITATPSKLHGFWVVDDESAGHRWYRRLDGSHQYIFGNTHYSFLSGYGPDDKPSGNDIAADIMANAQFFKKLRFSLVGDRYPNPTEKPFLDDTGQPTDAGDFSHRPNPKWFHERADLAVQTAFDHDLIADLILCGPDTEDARSTLRAAGNHGDPAPWLKYIAARYGSYPNVWLCLCNEYDIKKPNYSQARIVEIGGMMRQFLAYPTPLSVHDGSKIGWSAEFDRLPSWADHQIIQRKIRTLAPAADVIQATWKGTGDTPRNKPTMDDELSYQGDGDKHSQADTIESHLGVFLGGGYGTTGFKSGNKLGHYFWGKFDPTEHTAADNLKFLREVIDAKITFWKMAPDLSVFANLDDGFRGLAWPGHEYVLGTNKKREAIIARLPAGQWTIVCHDVISRHSEVLSRDASDTFVFDSPSNRAVLFHFKRNQTQPRSR